MTQPKTRESLSVIVTMTALEPDVVENKIYAPGIGLIKEIEMPGNFEITLVTIL
jgi:hypothetical protein